MIKEIKGLHHVTSMAADAGQINAFFTETLGLRRVKKTVNFDAPDVYHLYYGDEIGTPGSVMTYFPFGQMPRGKRGTGEVGVTEFAVAKGALPYWKERLGAKGVRGLRDDSFLGEPRLEFSGPDGDSFALVETATRDRTPWTGAGVPEEAGILGFHGARLRLRDAAPTAELLGFMGYQKDQTEGAVTRYRIEAGNAADTVDLEEWPDAETAAQGAGSVHHIAFAVEDRAAQLEVRKALMDTGFQVTPVIDRDYFWAIYFCTPGGVLFEIATNEPGFDRDEDTAHLGQALKLPTRYEPHRAKIESVLPDLSA
ncbi:MAG: ring-cleaving dioxygenase [Roseovarius sp.]|uniref:ring-cleaving dioxygenase n=1 Tax=Roseovarius sp. TaxID=1486281 RepID=UPI001B4192C3|nr:ring-cleaving dioxygenase [Roseovarius sp.]MBQ0750962.1 ring-cleaving dioxygenase [Roseovarius sp.]MBQ0809157.1 ring-cleaving dioxygenase [Roseovarius sp.]